MFIIISIIKKYQYFLFFLVLEIFCFRSFLNYRSYQKSLFLDNTIVLSGSIQSYFSSWQEYFSLQEANLKLSQENLNLRNQLRNTYEEIPYLNTLKADTIEGRNNEKYIKKYHVLMSKVIHNTSNLSNNYFQINRGYRQGIRKDMGVVTSDGVAGVVVSTTDNFANVLSVLNTTYKISAKIKNTDIIGYVAWDGLSATELVMDNYPLNTKMNLGDTVLTSQYSEKFIENTVIGVISDYAVKANKNSYSLRIKLAVDFNKLNTVYVIDNQFQDEMNSLK